MRSEAAKRMMANMPEGTEERVELIANNLMDEDWVKFTRYPCLEGFIDHWTGDCSSNPNYSESSLMLNMTADYFRLNGTGKWVCSSYRFLRDLKEFREGFTAEEMFDFIQYEDGN